MNTQPVHDPATGDLRGYAETVAMPGDISIGNLPNTDTPTDDMRGHEPTPTSEPGQDNNAMIVGAVAVAVLIGGIGIATYAMGMWDSAPMAPAPHAITANSVAPTLPAAAPQQAVVPAPAPPAAVVAPPVPAAAPIVKRSAAPRRAMPARPERVMTPPEPMPPVMTPVTPMITPPLEAAPITPAHPAIEPMPPVQSMPDQPAPAPQTPAPQSPPEPQ